MSLLPLIEEQMRRRPHAIAVEHNGRSVTYGELYEQSQHIACGLRAAGVQRRCLVAVYLDRSPELIATLLAIWQRGAAYLPLDPEHSAERTAFMLAHAGVTYVIAQRRLPGAVSFAGMRVLDIDALTRQPAAEIELVETPEPDSPAYVIYTSGSTGQPKGASISHRGLRNTIEGLQQDLQLGPSDVMLASNSIAFDISGEEYYLALTTGGCLHLVEREVVANGERLLKVLRRAGITIMIGLATSYRLLLAAGWLGDPNLQLTIGGEAVPLDLARALASRCRALWNHYGPTEASICATSERISADATSVTLGRPLPNVRIYVLDHELKPAEPGTSGEIVIGGPGVSLGYLHQPEMTQQCFLPDPFDDRPGAIMYRTGDCGALLEDGRLAFHGRADDQVKIRGFRIEPGEVEAALLNGLNVEAAVVRAIHFAADDIRLIAFLVCRSSLNTSRIRSTLRERLPSYMVPSEYIVLPAFPLTPNGKVDRRALDTLRLRSVTDTATNTAREDLETGLTHIWQSLFHTHAVDRSDSFFDLGGHSVLAVRMLAQVERAFGIRIPVSVLIERPTITQLAEYIRAFSQEEPGCLVLMQQGTGRPPLFVSHGVGGSLLTFRTLCSALDPGQTVYGLQIPASLELSRRPEGAELIRKVAQRYVSEMQAVMPGNVCHLAGHSSAGPILVEVARQLREAGCGIGLLAILDADLRGATTRAKPWHGWNALLEYLRRSLKELSLHKTVGTRELARRRVHHHKMKFQLWVVRRLHVFTRHLHTPFLTEGYLAAALLDFPSRYEGDAVLFAAADEPRDHDDATLGWGAVLGDRLEVVTVPGGHQTMFDEPYVRELALEISARLEAVAETAAMPALVPAAVAARGVEL